MVQKLEAEEHRIFGARFVDLIKHEGQPKAFKKSRFDVQAYANKEHGLLTHALTAQISSNDYYWNSQP